MEGLDLNRIPSKALNHTTRVLLGHYLNPEQLLLTDGISRDYNGLAEQMGFTYNDLRNFQRHENPTYKILEAWTDKPNTTIGELVNYLENIGRHDALEDVYPKLENDARSYLKRNTSIMSQESPLQVPEVTSCRIPDSRMDDSGILTRDDAHTGVYTMYDAFVCYADEDIDFVTELASYLESNLVGFKLFIRLRDMLAGHSEYETSMQLIQERCKRVLIILSPDFLNCPACDVQSSFAAGLGIDERCRKIIPIVYKPCEIPLMIKFISKIDFTRPGVKDWIWDKLISSLQDGPSSTFISTDRRYPTICNSTPFRELCPSEVGNSAITFPSTSNAMIAGSSSTPSITFPPTTSSLVSEFTASASCSSSPIVVQEVTMSEPAMTGNKTSNKQKSKFGKLFRRLPRKVDASQSNDSTPSTSYSNTTSGIYSQGSSFVSENIVGLDKPTVQNDAFRQ